MSHLIQRSGVCFFFVLLAPVVITFGLPESTRNRFEASPRFGGDVMLLVFPHLSSLTLAYERFQYTKGFRYNHHVALVTA